MHEHRTVFLRKGDSDLAFEIEMILTSGDDRALEAMRRGHEYCLGLAADEVSAGQDVALGLERRTNVEDRRQLFVGNTRFQHRLARRTLGGGRDREDRLTGVLNQRIREDRIIVHGAAIIILAGDVAWTCDGDDTRTFEHGAQIQGRYPAVRYGAESEGRIQSV